MNRSIRLQVFSRNVRRINIVSSCVCCYPGTVDMIHYTQQCNTVLYLHWYLYLVPGIHYGQYVLFEFSGNAEVHGTVRIRLMTYMNEVRTSLQTGYVRSVSYPSYQYLIGCCWWLQVAVFGCQHQYSRPSKIRGKGHSFRMAGVKKKHPCKKNTFQHLR